MVENIKLENLTTGAVLELSSMSTPYFILDACLWGAIESQRYEYKYINQIGVQITNTTLETRDIEITGWIVAEEPILMTQRKQVLNKFVSPLQTIRLYYKDKYIDFVPDSTISYGTSIEDNNEVISRFQITGVAPDPRFRDVAEQNILNAFYTRAFMFPLIFTEDNEYGGVVFGIKNSVGLLFNIHVDGDLPVGMKIKFRSLAGEVVNPIITNVVNQMYVKINKTLAKDEEVIINTNVGYKSIEGKLATESEYSNYFQYRDIDSAWLQLEPGDNILIYDADSNVDNLEVVINYNNAWLEVQEWD